MRMFLSKGGGKFLTLFLDSGDRTNPTQVNRSNRPRRASEAGRRNSANWPCTFGRRGAYRKI